MSAPRRARGTAKLVVLAAVTLATVIAAAVAVRERAASTAATETGGGLLFPGLTERLDEVSRITVDHDGAQYVIRRAESGDWVNPAMGDYPARPETVRAVLAGFAGLQRYEAKTARPELFARLDVDEPGPGARGARVTLADDDGEALAELIVGKVRRNLMGAGRDGVYVRLPGEDRAWLVEGALGLERAAADWSDRTALNIRREDIATIALTQADGRSITLVRPEEGARDLTVVPLPEGQKVASQATLNGIGSTLETVSFDAVRSADDATLPDPPASRGAFVTFDGLEITASAGEPDEEGRALVRFAAEAGEDASDEAKARAAEINERFGNWVFLLPKFRAEKLRHTADDLLAPETPAAAEGDGGGETAQ